MKNYIVYTGNQMLRRFDTAAEGIAWADKTAQDWANMVAPDRIPVYRVCYNGNVSELIYDTKNGFAKGHAVGV